nr:peptidase C39 family protein [Leucobacter weissii]
MLGEEERDAWLAIPEVYHPEVVELRGEHGVEAALLVTHRPHTAYRKIARLRALNDAALDAAVAALLDEARGRGGVASVKWEDADGGAGAHALRNGFSPLPAPIPSGAGTAAAAGYVRYLDDWPHRSFPYYRQTTEYSCGPVALLMAQAGASDGGITRAQELRIWRRAAHFPGCGPTGLAVHADLDVYRPEVEVSTSGPLLNEHLGDEVGLEVRALVDADDEDRAAELGIPVRHRLTTVDEIAAHVSADRPVLLLIDELLLHGTACAHWVLAHGYRDGFFLLHDPWIDAENGESWVDTHDLPIAASDVDAITWWGDPAYRGVIVLHPASA